MLKDGTVTRGINRINMNEIRNTQTVILINLVMNGKLLVIDLLNDFKACIK